MCYEVINKIERLDAVALVTNPQDKRCIVELVEDSNEEKFNLIKGIKSLLLIPLNDFIIKKINEPNVVNTKIITKGNLVVTPTYQIKISINNMY